MSMSQILANPRKPSEVQPVACTGCSGMRYAQTVAIKQRHSHDAVYNLQGGAGAWSLAIEPMLPRY